MTVTFLNVTYTITAAPYNATNVAATTTAASGSGSSSTGSMSSATASGSGSAAATPTGAAAAVHPEMTFGLFMVALITAMQWA